MTTAERHAQIGELNALLDRGVNVGSPKFLDYLYGEPPAGWGFPKRFIKEGNKNTTRLARSVDALLATFRQNRDRRLELALLLSDRKTQLESLNAKLDRDGRMRFSFNIAGTKVGRMSCGASNTGSGFNGQTISDRHKCLFPADEGCDFYSVDLKGADGWTIGAECAALGDTRMWDDLASGLKPANAVTLLMLHGAEVNRWPMEQCLAAQDKLDKKDWRYRALKIGIWSMAYGAGDVSISETILETSWKRTGELVYVSAADCKNLRTATLSRYTGLARRMERIKMILVRDGKLTPCEGAPARDFFGRKTDNATQAAAYAYAPAFVTAYANNLALLALWNDPENVAPDGQRIARLRLPIHDSLTFVAPVEKQEWVASRIPHWFNNSVTVAGRTFTIPYEAARGPSWDALEPL